MFTLEQVRDLAVKEAIVEKSIERIDADFSMREINLKTDTRTHTEVIGQARAFHRLHRMPFGARADSCSRKLL